VTLHVLVEGTTEREFFEGWLPRKTGTRDFAIHAHQGKGKLPADAASAPNPLHRGLLDQLPAKLRGFAEALDPDQDSVLIVVDRDADDCQQLATEIRNLVTSMAPGLRVEVRVSIEELEAYYLGDLKGVKTAFPGADLTRARSVDPDSVTDAWEFFGEIVGDDGGHKAEWARAMGRAVTTAESQSRSASFRALCRALGRLRKARPVAKPKRRHRHEAKPPGKKEQKRRGKRKKR
jgi:hypothetical protein